MVTNGNEWLIRCTINFCTRQSEKKERLNNKRALCWLDYFNPDEIGRVFERDGNVGTS